VAAGEPAGIAFAPGRVNLIGEHTDYNDGFVLPMAIEEGIAAAFRPNRDDLLRVHASDIGDTREIPLALLRERKVPASGWFRYPAGMAAMMLGAGAPLSGTTIALASSLPSGAGLSSSAAVELVIARALAAAAGIEWDARRMSILAQQAEQEFAGVACGIMDQMAVAFAQAGRALLLDCRSLETTGVELPADVRVVIMNSGVRRSLASSAYNDRRAACERAVAATRAFDPRVRALRDVDGALLERSKQAMDQVAFRRASHVVAENTRPGQFARALDARDLPAAGSIMLDSHASLRDLYEVSCAELDVLVELAMAAGGCYGARLTGAGFGGCAIALVDADRVETFSAAVAPAYRERTGLECALIVSRPSAGARLVG
jgi:galactokinase